MMDGGMEGGEKRSNGWQRKEGKERGERGGRWKGCWIYVTNPLQDVILVLLTLHE
jgi:hypothetical protein